MIALSKPNVLNWWSTMKNRLLEDINAEPIKAPKIEVEYMYDGLMQGWHAVVQNGEDQYIDTGFGTIPLCDVVVYEIRIK